MKNSMLVNYSYARQAAQPEWFDGRYEIELSATSGSSPFNEWAGFHSREDAITVLLNTAHNYQDFLDNFEQIGDEVYHKEDVDAVMQRLGFDADTGYWSEFIIAHRDEILAACKPAELQDIFRAMSRF